MTHDRTKHGSSSVYAKDVRELKPEQIEFQPVFVNQRDVPPFSLLPGVTMQSIAGVRIMLTWVTIDPGQTVPQHQHPQEQAGVVLEGVLSLTMLGETHELKAGDAYTIPPDLPHSASSKDGCKVLDVFSPARDDFLPYAVRG
ncbi:MAG: cupin domain-containing protein [Thermomicrobiales bacterium]